MRGHRPINRRYLIASPPTTTFVLYLLPILQHDPVLRCNRKCTFYVPYTLAGVIFSLFVKLNFYLIFFLISSSFGRCFYVSRLLSAVNLIRRSLNDYEKSHFHSCSIQWLFYCYVYRLIKVIQNPTCYANDLPTVVPE